MLVSLKQIKRIEKVEKLKKGTYTQHRVSTNIQPREVGLRYSSGVSDFICAAFCALISSGVYNKRHNKPHIHVEYQDETAVVEIETGVVLAGSFPSKKLKLVQAWIEIHQDELMADWKLAVEGKEVFKINPLQ